MSFDDALTHAREMRFSDKSEYDLHQMLIVIGNHAGQTAGLYTSIQVPHAVKMIQEELVRRQRHKNHQEVIADQQKATEQGKSLHGETMIELKVLKESVDQLGNARRIDKAILIATIAGVMVGLAGLIFAVIALNK